MIGVTSAEEIAHLERQKVIISVFVASGYDREVVQWLQDTWQQLHIDTGDHWYLLVPVLNPGLPGIPSDVNFELADEIRSYYGLDEEATPCLVFDNFLDERQNVLSLKGDDDLRKKMMIRMKNIINAEGQKPHTDLWRQHVTGKLFNSGQWTHVEKQLLKMTKEAASLLPNVLDIVRGK